MQELTMFQSCIDYKGCNLKPCCMNYKILTSMKPFTIIIALGGGGGKRGGFYFFFLKKRAPPPLF